ncbi:MAG TPA: type II toxin-antitoxin system RelE/ParE family toxin [Longimicrobium sp.]
MNDSLELVPTPWFIGEVRALQQEDRERIDRRLSDFARKGWTDSVADGSVKHLRDGIHELRILGRGAAFRLLFFLMPGRSPRVVVLSTCAAKAVMKKPKRMEAEIERAKDRRARWLQQQNKRGADGG